jgi:hypothetical protein
MLLLCWKPDPETSDTCQTLAMAQPLISPLLRFGDVLSIP